MSTLANPDNWPKFDDGVWQLCDIKALASKVRRQLITEDRQKQHEEHLERQRFRPKVRKPHNRPGKMKH